MHSADQSGAAGGACGPVRPGGVLLLQFHALSTIVREGQWNVPRHGHYAYYSTSALAGTSARRALALVGLAIRPIRRHGAIGGETHTDGHVEPDISVQPLLAEDARTGARDPDVVGSLQRHAQSRQ